MKLFFPFLAAARFRCQNYSELYVFVKNETLSAQLLPLQTRCTFCSAQLSILQMYNTHLSIWLSVSISLSLSLSLSLCVWVSMQICLCLSVSLTAPLSIPASRTHNNKTLKPVSVTVLQKSHELLANLSKHVLPFARSINLLQLLIEL